MPATPSNPPSIVSGPVSQVQVRRASIASVSSQPKASTAQALKGYAYLKSRSSRSRSHSSAD